MVAVLASSFPSRIMVLFRRLEHFRANSNASIQHRPKQKSDDSHGNENSKGVFHTFISSFQRRTGQKGSLKDKEKELLGSSRTMERDSGWKRLDLSAPRTEAQGNTHTPNPLI